MTDLTTSGQNGGGSGSTTATLQEHATDVVGSVREQGTEVARSAMEHARSVVDAAGEQMQRQGGEQATRLADSLSSVSSELRSMADSASDGALVGDITRSLAETADRTATLLRDEGPSGVVRRASEFGREHPVQFLALAAGAGFAVARIVRNSDAQRLQEVARDAVSGDDGSNGDLGAMGSSTGAGLGAGSSGSSPRPAEAAPLSGTGTPAVPPGGDVMDPGGVPSTPGGGVSTGRVGP
ncbi:hypothetical protein [Dermatobacter hominis]|uniref:hypothetical protein n=1 Tax=Dermatobacter hominis TaxID=2884263 RepID=UPI001D103467|nr:hypothetical protein [Dermatobacter hominis]UDY37499.1 hypothetical protein LH044_08135 [Dermatobacter hominis]